MRVGDRDRGVAVGALQRERRRQAGRIRERIEPGKVRVEARAAQPVVRGQLPVELQRELILRELGGHDVALPHERIAADRRPGDDVVADRPRRPARGAGMTKSPVTGFRRLRRFSATSEMQAVSVGAGALRLRNRRAGSPGFSAANAARRFSFVRAPSNRAASACGRTVMLLAVGTNPVSACVR